MEKLLIIKKDEDTGTGGLANPMNMGDGELLVTMLDATMNMAGQIAKLHNCDDPKCHVQKLANSIILVFETNFSHLKGHE